MCIFVIKLALPCTLDANVLVKAFSIINLCRTSGGRGVMVHKIHGSVKYLGFGVTVRYVFNSVALGQLWVSHLLF